MLKRPFGASFAIALLAEMTAAQALSLTSPDIKPGARIAEEQVLNAFGCVGKNISPALNWSGAPKGTKSFALSVFDSDAPTGDGFFHWMVFDIPAGVSGLPKGAGDPSSDMAPKGALQARSDFGSRGYGGPCPPEGDKPHHYHFTIFAVDTEKIDLRRKCLRSACQFQASYPRPRQGRARGCLGALTRIK